MVIWAMARKVRLRSQVARNRLATLGLTQAALATACGVSLRTVQRWFGGQRIDVAAAETVAATLKLGTAVLFEGVETHGVHGSTVLRLVVRALGRHDFLANSFRAILLYYPRFTELFALTAHPMRGFVGNVKMEPLDYHGFVALRVQLSCEPARLVVFERISKSLRVAKAQLFVQGDSVWVFSNFESQSMRASLLPGRRFAMQVWVGPEVKELVFVASVDFDVVRDRAEQATRQTFDMSARGAEHAICLRPGRLQLLAAGLPVGFDRIIHRDATRTEVPIPPSGMASWDPER